MITANPFYAVAETIQAHLGKVLVPDFRPVADQLLNNFDCLIDAEVISIHIDVLQATAKIEGDWMAIMQLRDIAPCLDALLDDLNESREKIQSICHRVIHRMGDLTDLSLDGILGTAKAGI